MKLFFLSTLACCLFSLPLFSQTEEAPAKPEKRIEIVKKTIDENGQEQVTRIVREGDEVTDEEVQRLLQEHRLEGKMTMDVEVTVDEEGQETIQITQEGADGERRIRVVEQGIDLNQEDTDERIMIFKSDDGEVTEMKDEDVIIIKKKTSGETMTIDVTTDGDHQNIWVEEGSAEGEVIIIEEEIIEEVDENGKVTKKTTKKKKTVKSKGKK